MILCFEVRNRAEKEIILRQDDGLSVDRIKGEEELFPLFTLLIKRNDLNLADLTEVAISVSSESSTTEQIVYALTNSLLYSLGLKSVQALTYPEPSANF